MTGDAMSGAIGNEDNGLRYSVRVKRADARDYSGRNKSGDGTTNTSTRLGRLSSGAPIIYTITLTMMGNTIPSMKWPNSRSPIYA